MSGSVTNWDTITSRAAAGDAVARLELYLLKGVLDTTAAIATEDHSPTESSESEHAFRLLSEVLFFLMHMSSRTAAAVLDPIRRERLLRRLSADLPAAFLDFAVGSWPDDLKEGVRNEFEINLNRAEAEYTGYTQRPPGDTATTATLLATLVLPFAENLCAVLGLSPEPANLDKIISAISPYITELTGLVAEAGKYPFASPPQFS